MYLFEVVIIVLGITTIKAEVDCSQRPPHVDFKSCCELTSLISEEVKEKCGGQDFGQHHGSPPGPPDHQHGPPGGRGGPHKFGPHKHCFLSCVVNETGILVDGELQEDELTSYLNELFGDNEKVEFVNNKFLLCHEKQKELASKWPEHKNGPPHCLSRENGMLMGCTHMETFKDCPDSFWSNTDECNEARDHFNQCWPPSKGQEEGGEEI